MGSDLGPLLFWLSMIKVTAEVSISEGDISEEFVRASGPGGQNVNKVATAVQLKFNAAGSSLPEGIKHRLYKLAGSRISDSGYLIITARRYRIRERNRQEARERLISLIRSAAVKPKPRKITRPTAASVQKRIESKKQKSMSKQLRKPVRMEDE